MRGTELAAEGKTKRIWHTSNPREVLIESKVDITAGDGDRRATMAGKDAWATETTVNCFRLLEEESIPTHFLAREDSTTFKADKVEMIPLELVARRLAHGSFCKRRPDVAPQTRFDDLVIEFFEKDDAQHDPLVLYDAVGQRILRYQAKLPLSEGFMNETPWNTADHIGKVTLDELLVLRELTHQAFCVFEAAWHKQAITLVDLKIECGYIPKTGEIIIADVIDNDSWRIWPNGDPDRQLDKQAFRDLGQVDAATLDAVAEKYALVAAATRKFSTQDQ